jgi:hypothetical protein
MRCTQVIPLTKALGVYIDEFLSREKHIDKITKKVSSGIGAILQKVKILCRP